MTKLLFDHYVVLMLENRSFDHLFGYLGVGDGLPARGATNYLRPGDARAQTPDVTVPVQPTALDAMQREMLDGSVHLDPDPRQRDTKRTRDIQDPAQAKQFVHVQIAKRLEHNLAAKGRRGKTATASAYNQLPSSTVSPARIAELRRPAKPPGIRP
jgi:phospholipase C